MTDAQQVISLLFGLIGLISFFLAIISIKRTSKPGKLKHINTGAYGLTPILYPWGIFVWGDALIFGLFWFFASLISIVLNDWNLFGLIFSIFWVVRGIGETVYWFNQQFSTVERVPLNILPFHRFFKDDSVWFIVQIIMQCITVVSIILSLYFAKMWLASL